MRYYLIDDEGEGYCFNLGGTVKHSNELYSFLVSEYKDNKNSNRSRVYVKRIAEKYYVSHDQIIWKKIARQNVPRSLVHIDKDYKLFRGFKPSSLGQQDAGTLITKMPGKVIKVLVKEGEKVCKGDPLLILEAMKMENEMKANIDGQILKVHVAEGQQVEAGLVLIDLDLEKK